jgi:hypothetical protein
MSACGYTNDEKKKILSQVYIPFPKIMSLQLKKNITRNFEIN